MDTTRRELMTQRDAALRAGNIPEFQRLTTALAALPLKGIPELTQQDIERWNKRTER